LITQIQFNQPSQTADAVYVYVHTVEADMIFFDMGNRNVHINMAVILIQFDYEIM